MCGERECLAAAKELISVPVIALYSKLGKCENVLHFDIAVSNEGDDT